MVVTNWICIKCGVTNPKNFFKCQMCQEQKPIFWECSSCKTKNPTAAAKCSQCRRKRPALFNNAIVKGLSNVKFNLQVSNTGLKTERSQEQQQTPATAEITANGQATTPVENSGTMALSGVAPSALSTVAPSAMSTAAMSQMTKSTLSKHMSSYDVFRKLIKPSRTVKQISYEDREDKFNETIKECKDKKTPYTDKLFPSNARSLYYNPEEMKKTTTENKPARVFWLRPNNIRVPDTQAEASKLKWTVMNNPTARDIIQGILGNCWLLSALAVVVGEKPNLLDKILASKEINTEGVYRVRLYKDGKLTSIMVDNQFPCDHKRLLIYSQAKRRQLFVPIIEKAMAKMYGCYESLVLGQTTDGLSALTGYPCRSIKIQSNDQQQQQQSPQQSQDQDQPDEEESTLNPDFIWTLLMSYQSAGFLMGAACGQLNHDQPEDNQIYQSKGLMNRHAYSIISLATIDNDTRLLQLRNPWGTQTWNGDWSDKSDLWTEEHRKELRPNQSTEGVFWISFGDFQKYFEKIDVCKIREGWHETRFEGYFPFSANDTRYMCVFELNVEESGTEIEITLHQESRRSAMLKTVPLIPICTAMFKFKDDVAANLTGDMIDYSGYKIREFVGCDVMVDKGVYTVPIYAFNHWNFSEELKQSAKYLRPRFVLSVHSSREVSVNCYCPSPTIIGDTLVEMAMVRGRKKKHNEDVVSYYLHENWSGLVVVIENRSQNAYLEVIFDASESTNLTTTRGNLRTQDTIPPMNRQLVNILSQTDVAQNYYLSYQMSYRVTNAITTINHNPDISQMACLHSPRPFKQIRN